MKYGLDRSRRSYGQDTVRSENRVQKFLHAGNSRTDECGFQKDRRLGSGKRNVLHEDHESNVRRSGEREHEQDFRCRD